MVDLTEIHKKIAEQTEAREREIKEKSGPYESFIYPLDFEVKRVLACHYANRGIAGEICVDGFNSSTETGMGTWMKIEVTPENNSGIERLLFKGNFNIKLDDIIRAYIFHGIEFQSMHHAMINIQGSEFRSPRELEQKIYMPRESYNKEERALFIESLKHGIVERIDISAYANEELYEKVQKRLTQEHNNS